MPSSKPTQKSLGMKVTEVTERDATRPKTGGALPPELVEERPDVSIVTPDKYPNAANGKDIAGRSSQSSKSKDRLNDGSLSSSEMQDAGIGEDEGPTK